MRKTDKTIKSCCEWVVLFLLLFGISFGALAQKPPCDTSKYKITLVGGTGVYDPVANETTFTYDVRSGASPAISHWNLALCAPCDYVLRYTAPAGAEYSCGLDPTTLIVGIKFDNQFGNNETQRYTIVLRGNFPTGTITGAVKFGPNECYQDILGPICEPDIRVEKKVLPEGFRFSNLNNVIQYSIVVTNTGFYPLTNVVVNDPLLGLVNYPVGNLAVGASFTIPAGVSKYTVGDVCDLIDLDNCEPEVYNKVTAAGTYLAQTVTDSDDETVFGDLPPVVVTPPKDLEVGPCISQKDLDKAFDDWVKLGTATGGCNLDVKTTNDKDPDICGSVTIVTWTAKSDCEKDVVKTAKFTVKAPDKIVAYCSDMIDVPQCSTAGEIDVLFAAWKAGFGYSGGCNPKDNMTELAALDWRDYFDEFTGGSVSFTYIVWDDCSRDEVTCEFVVPQCEVKCETAYARGELANCFIGDGFANWGWTNYIPQEGNYLMPLYAGAAGCNTMNGWGQVGTVEVKYSGGKMLVTYMMDKGYSLNEVHVYVGCGKYPKLRNGKETIAPGQYTFVKGGMEKVVKFSVEFTKVSGPVYLIAHTVVCNVPGSGTMNGNYTKAIACAMPKSDTSELYDLNNRGINIQVMPNPFRNQTQIHFSVERDTRAVVEVYTLQGSRVAVLFDGPAIAEDTYSVSFTEHSQAGRQIYLVVVRTDYGQVTRQIIAY